VPHARVVLQRNPLFAKSFNIARSLQRPRQAARRGRRHGRLSRDGAAARKNPPTGNGRGRSAGFWTVRRPLGLTREVRSGSTCEELTSSKSGLQFLG